MRDLTTRDCPQAVLPSDSDLAKDEQRVAPRVGVLIRAAKLLTAEGEFLCVIRDVSETGISARIFHTLPEGGEMLFELQNGDRYEAELVWQEEGRAGFRFVRPADLERFLATPSPYAKRPIRLNVEVSAELAAGDRLIDAPIHDISQQGAKVGGIGRMPVDARVTLRAEGMRETQAKIRWYRDGFCGLVFEDTMQYDELATTALAMQRKRRAIR